MSLLTPNVDFRDLKISDRMLIDSMELSTKEAQKMVKLFLDHETDWNSQNNNNGGKLKLYSIFTKGNKVTLSNFLATCSVNMGAKDVDGNTPLHYLAMNKNKGIVECFKDYSFDVFNVHAHNEKNETALHIAALHGNPEVVQFLLEKGADVNAAAHDKRTPLYYVIKVELPMHNRVKCTSLLMLYGADVGIIIEGDSVLDDILFCRPDDDDDLDCSLETMSMSNPLDLLDPVLAQLAINEAIGKPLHSHNCMLIDTFSKDQIFNLKAMYTTFKKELYETKQHKIFENETLFDILTNKKSAEKIAQYIKKSGDILKLEDKCCKIGLRTYYQDYVLKKRFLDAIKLVNSKEQHV